MLVKLADSELLWSVFVFAAQHSLLIAMVSTRGVVWAVVEGL